MSKLLYKKGHIPWTKGRKFTEEHRKKISDSNKGKKKPPISEESRNKMSIASRGRKWSIESRKRFGEMKKGEKNNFWKGGITEINIKIRGSLEYRLWRTSVFERDEYTCVWCLTTKSPFNADHIKPFALFPELRFAIDNGRTLCKNVII